MKRLVPLVLLLFAFSAGAAQARRNDHGGRGGDEVRVAGDCSRGAVSSLRVRARGDRIEVRFRVRQTRGRGVWRLAIVHESRVSSRATLRTTRGDGSFELRRTLPDLRGSDAIVVQAWGPSGLACRAAASLAG